METKKKKNCFSWKFVREAKEVEFMATDFKIAEQKKVDETFFLFFFSSFDFLTWWVVVDLMFLMRWVEWYEPSPCFGFLIKPWAKVLPFKNSPNAMNNHCQICQISLTNSLLLFTRFPPTLLKTHVSFTTFSLANLFMKF